jgi:hypothetical protein
MSRVRMIDPPACQPRVLEKWRVTDLALGSSLGLSRVDMEFDGAESCIVLVNGFWSVGSHSEQT